MTDLPDSYLGGKNGNGTYHKIINQIPKHKTFVTGFAGKCGIKKNILPTNYNIIIDMDINVIEYWSNLHKSSQKHTILRTSFLELDLPCFYDPETIIYLDPPYLPEVRSSANKYKHELTRDQHVQLLSKVSKFTAMVAISCYDSELYRTMLDGWRYIKFMSQTRGGPREETLYMNYECPTDGNLHDPRYTGINFRSRDLTKKRINTIIKKISKLPDMERSLLKMRLKDELPGFIG